MRRLGNLDFKLGDTEARRFFTRRYRETVLENLVRFIVNRSLEDYILIGVDFLPFLKKDKQNPLAH